MRNLPLNYCYLALGSNLNSPERQLRHAIAKLRRSPVATLLATAKLYRNPAQGRRSQPDFHNTAVLIKTRLNPKHLLRYCHQIEKSQGRTRSIRWGSRTLDIDIIFYGPLKIDTQSLQIPHPHYHMRDFVLIPLSEITKPALLREIHELKNYIEAIAASDGKQTSSEKPTLPRQNGH